MDPITIGLMAVGTGLQIYGGMKQSGIAKQQAAIGQQQASISADEAAQEQGINYQKQQQMQLQASRMQLENFRNVQRARAQGLNTAVSQGAQFGSGLQGGQAQATDQGYTNALGINQNLEIGNNIFGYNNAISQDRIKSAGLQSQSAALGGDAATASGISSLGGALVKTGPTIGAMAKGINFSGLNLFSPGSLSGGFGNT